MLNCYIWNTQITHFHLNIFCWHFHLHLHCDDVLSVASTYVNLFMLSTTVWSIAIHDNFHKKLLELSIKPVTP